MKDVEQNLFVSSHTLQNCDARTVHYQKQASIWNTWLLIKTDFSGLGPGLDFLLVTALLEWKMLSVLAPLDCDPLNPQGYSAASCSWRILMWQALKFRGKGRSWACMPVEEGGEFYSWAGAGLDHFIFVGRICWALSTSCLLQCGAENCCAASADVLPNDFTLSIALRNASFPWMHIFIYLSILPLVLKGISSLQMDRW